MIYIDSEFRCHTSYDDGWAQIDTDVFDGKCPAYIEGYRFIPHGDIWKREDGTLFYGEMIAPWKPWGELDAIQREYERNQVEEISNQNTELLNIMADMVEDVYNQDLATIGVE